MDAPRPTLVLEAVQVGGEQHQGAADAVGSGEQDIRVVSVPAPVTVRIVLRREGQEGAAPGHGVVYTQMSDARSPHIS
jgi:hypothetical protein